MKQFFLTGSLLVELVVIVNSPNQHRYQRVDTLNMTAICKTDIILKSVFCQLK